MLFVRLYSSIFYYNNHISILHSCKCTLAICAQLCFCRYGLGNKTITCPVKARFKVSNEVGEKRVVTVITIKRRIALKACENICFD